MVGMMRFVGQRRVGRERKVEGRVLDGAVEGWRISLGFG